MIVLAEMAIRLYQKEGITLKEHMDHLYSKYGFFCSNNGYYTMEDPSIDIMGQLKASLQQETSDEILSIKTKSSLMQIQLNNGCRIQLRPSGTEPKFKYYIEMQGRPGQARESLQKELEYCETVLLDKLLEPNKYGLKR